MPHTASCSPALRSVAARPSMVNCTAQCCRAAAAPGLQPATSSRAQVQQLTTRITCKSDMVSDCSKRVQAPHILPSLPGHASERPRVPGTAQVGPPGPAHHSPGRSGRPEKGPAPAARPRPHQLLRSCPQLPDGRAARSTRWLAIPDARQKAALTCAGAVRRGRQKGHVSVAWCRPDQLRPGCAALMAAACTHADIKVVGRWPGHCCIQTGLWWSGLQPDCHVRIAADAGEAGHRGPQPLLPGILRLSGNHRQKLICSTFTMASLQGDTQHLYSALLHRGSHPCMAAVKAPSMLDAGAYVLVPGRWLLSWLPQQRLAQ